METLKQGTRVKFRDPVKGTGTICGISSIAQPFIGYGYIIEPDIPIGGYSHIVLFEHKIEVVDEEEATRQRILKDRDAQEAYEYARDEIGGRWPEAESFIMEDSYFAHLYAINIIKERWPEAEDAILEDETYAISYACAFGLRTRIIFEEDEVQE